ncbi:MAG: hypothetical protein WBG19_09695 [Thermoplasmata archaeon]
MYVKFGSAKATANLTSGAVSSVTVNDGGFGFTLPPTVQFLGGGGIGWNYSDGSNTGSTLPQSISPNNFATGLAVLGTSAIAGKKVSSVTVLNGGAKYLQAPYVSILNSFNDPFGVGTPSATSGAWLSAGGGSWTQNGTMCTTDPVSVYCATTGAAYTAYWSA